MNIVERQATPQPKRRNLRHRLRISGEASRKFCRPKTRLQLINRGHTQPTNRYQTRFVSLHFISLTNRHDTHALGFELLSRRNPVRLRLGTKLPRAARYFGFGFSKFLSECTRNGGGTWSVLGPPSSGPGSGSGSGSGPGRWRGFGFRIRCRFGFTCRLVFVRGFCGCLKFSLIGIFNCGPRIEGIHSGAGVAEGICREVSRFALATSLTSPYETSFM